MLKSIGRQNIVYYRGWRVCVDQKLREDDTKKRFYKIKIRQNPCFRYFR